MLTRIPLTITATATGHTTDGVLVAVLASELDAVEEQLERISLAYIEATNPGIDMDEVKRTRATRA